MENSSERLARFCRQLALYRQPGNDRRHRQRTPIRLHWATVIWWSKRLRPRLVASVCSSRRRCFIFSYTDRWALLIEQGIAGIDNVTLHSGSAYMISRATFRHFKEKGLWTTATRSIRNSSVNIWLQRWGLPYRFVGVNRFVLPTCAYNQRMHDILHDPKRSGLVIEVVELARVEKTARLFPPLASENR